MHFRNHPTANFAPLRLFCECYDFAAVGAVQRGKGISDSAAADLIASIAPLREGRHKARPA